MNNICFIGILEKGKQNSWKGLIFKILIRENFPGRKQP